MDDMLRVGTIINSHGIRGEVKVFPTTDDVNRFKKLKKVLIAAKNENVLCEIQSVKFFKNQVILKFKEFDSINDIEKYKGSDLLIHREDAVKCEDDEYFICDIIGAEVLLEDGATFGVLKEVLQTGANDVYVVETLEKKEVLLPVIKDCVLDIDDQNKIVKIRLMPGLL